MRKAFLYVQALIYLAIVASILLIFSALFFSVFQKSFGLTQELTEKRNITEVLDIIADDPDSEYVLRNNRIARKKTGYLYLTPKEIIVESFEVQPTKIVIKTKMDLYERLYKR